MIVATLIALASLQEATPPPPPQAEDIVVIGKRREQLRRLRLVTRRDRNTGVTRCIFKRRSGDRSLDDAICTLTIACVATVTMVTKAQAQADMTACMTPTITALVPGTPWSASALTDR